MSFSNYAAQALLNYMFGKTSNFDTQPTIYVSLHTGDPGETGASECADSGAYARVATAATDWNTATLADPSLLDNAVAIEFPSATAAWGTITHFGLWDSGTHGAGNFLGGGALSDQSKSVVNGDTPLFAIGDLDVTLD